jgi:hypothetical protein
MMTGKQQSAYMLVALIVGISSGVLAYNFGEPAKKRAEAARLTSFAVAPESIQVSTTNASLELTPIPENLSGRSGYHLGWALLHTDSWVIVPNANEGKSLCPQALSDFIDANRPKGVDRSWQLRKMDALLRSHRNTTVEVQVLVPRPQTAPPGLVACPSLGYDSDRKLLTFEGRPVAILANEQRLVIAPVMPPRSGPRFTY